MKYLLIKLLLFTLLQHNVTLGQKLNINQDFILKNNIQSIEMMDTDLYDDMLFMDIKGMTQSLKYAENGLISSSLTRYSYGKDSDSSSYNMSTFRMFLYRDTIPYLMIEKYKYRQVESNINLYEKDSVYELRHYIAIKDSTAIFDYEIEDQDTLIKDQLEYILRNTTTNFLNASLFDSINNLIFNIFANKFVEEESIGPISPSESFNNNLKVDYCSIKLNQMKLEKYINLDNVDTLLICIDPHFLREVKLIADKATQIQCN